MKKLIEHLILKTVFVWALVKKWFFEDLGFENLSDLITSTFAFKTKFLMLHVYGFTFSGLIALWVEITNQTESWIYKPFRGIGILLIATITDFILGASHSIEVKQERFSWQKIPRSAVRFAFQCLFIGLFFNMNMVWPLIIQFWIVDGLLIAFILTTAWSAFENAYNLKLVTKEQFETVQSVVNIKNLLNKFKK